MQTHYQHSRYVDWNTALPLKVENFPPGMIYVNEYIADGSKLGFGSVLYHCKLGNEVVVEDLATCIDVIAGDKVTFGKSARFLSEYMATRGQVPGRCAQFGDYATIGERSIFERFAIFGNHARIGGFASFEHSAYFGDDATLASRVDIGGSASFGRNLQVGCESRFGEGTKFQEHTQFDAHCWFDRNCTFGDETIFNDNPRFDASGVGIYSFGKGSEVKVHDWRTGKVETMSPYRYLRLLQLEASGKLNTSEAERQPYNLVPFVRDTPEKEYPTKPKPAKVHDLDDLIYLDAIPYVSLTLARRLLDKFGSLERIRSATREELMDIDSVGRVKAAQLIQYFREERAGSEQQK